METKILPTQVDLMAKEIEEEIAIFVQQKKYYNAIKLMDKLLDLNRYDSELFFLRAKLHFLLKEYDEAYKFLDFFARENPRDYRLFLLNIEIKLKTNKKEEAIKVLDNFLFLYLQERIIFSALDIYEEVDEIINKIKKIYKWNKLIKMCPSIKAYENKKRKILKNWQKNIADINKDAKDKEEIKTKMEEIREVKEPYKNPSIDEASEVFPLEKVQDKSITKIPAKDLAQNPKKEIAINQSKDLDNICNKAVDILKEKNISTINKEVQEAKLDDFDTIFKIIKTLWEKGRLDEKDKDILLKSQLLLIEKAIKEQYLSLKKQIWLFTYVANLFRNREIFDSAIYLLRSALKYDDEDSILLKNIGYTLIQKGEIKAGLTFLEDSKKDDLYHFQIDFTVLDLINTNKGE